MCINYILESLYHRASSFAPSAPDIQRTQVAGTNHCLTRSFTSSNHLSDKVAPIVVLLTDGRPIAEPHRVPLPRNVASNAAVCIHIVSSDCFCMLSTNDSVVSMSCNVHSQNLKLFESNVCHSVRFNESFCVLWH